MNGKDVARLRDLLGPLGKSLRVDDPAAIGRLWHRWPEIVGGDVARHAEPTSLKDGVLRIRTTTPVWATEIGYLAEDIRSRVNDAVGKSLVTEVRVWTSPAPIKGPRDSDAGAPDRSFDGPRRPAADDPETAFRRAFEAWSKRRAKGAR